ncbi:hypothetical protein ACTFIR_011514 [Dictyostelium discoideum]
MGNYIFTLYKAKQIEDMDNYGFPSTNDVVDEDKKNNVYVVLCHPKGVISKESDALIGTSSGHMSVELDFLGASEGDADKPTNIAGFDMHLTLEKEDNPRLNVTSASFYRKQQSKYVKKVALVGKFNHQFKREWEFYKFANESFDSFIEKHQHSSVLPVQWNRDVNCHTYSKFLVCDIMGLQWPDSIPLIPEQYPSLVDIEEYIKILRIMSDIITDNKKH